MKKNVRIMLLAFAAALLLSLIPAQAFADTTVADAFPDKAFRSFLRSEYNIKAAAPMSEAQEELDAVNELFMDENPVEDFTGIEFFHNLKSISILRNHKMTTLDLSRNPKIEDITIMDTSLESIRLGNNTALTYLDLTENKLSSVDLSGVPNLRIVDLKQNELTSVNVSRLPSLEYLDISNNPLKVVPDVSQNPELVEFNCLGTGFPAIWDVVAEKEKYTYTGRPIEPLIKKVTGKAANGKGKAQEIPLDSCTVTYKHNVKSGYGYVVVMPKPESGYSGLMSAQFDIKPPRVTGVKVKTRRRGKVEVSWSTEKPAEAEANYYMIWYQVKGQKRKVVYVNNVNRSTRTITIPKKWRGKKVTVKVAAGKLVEEWVEINGRYSRAITKKVRK